MVGNAAVKQTSNQTDLIAIYRHPSVCVCVFIVKVLSINRYWSVVDDSFNRLRIYVHKCLQNRVIIRFVRFQLGHYLYIIETISFACLRFQYSESIDSFGHCVRVSVCVSSTVILWQKSPKKNCNWTSKSRWDIPCTLHIYMASHTYFSAFVRCLQQYTFCRIRASVFSMWDNSQRRNGSILRKNSKQINTVENQNVVTIVLRVIIRSNRPGRTGLYGQFVFFFCFSPLSRTHFCLINVQYEFD